MSKKPRYDDTQIWRSSEIVNLLNAVKAKTSLASLSSMFKRSPECIKEKLNNLAADYYFTDLKIFKEIQEVSGITEKDFLVTRFKPAAKTEMNVTPPPETNVEIENIDLCTSMAFNILDTIIGTTILLRSTIKELSTFNQIQR